MGIPEQNQLFGWKDIDSIGDLERLLLVLKYIPDEKLIDLLIKKRDKGRDDYPVESIWNSIIAGVVFQHISVESLRRELRRNGGLRELCGFNVLLGVKSVPSPSSYSRFLTNLILHEKEVDKMFDELVKKLTDLLPDFGEILAIDGKAIQSHANGKNDIKNKKRDGRRDIDADWGKKVYNGNNKDGSAWKKVISWFGYRLHLVIDANYELTLPKQQLDFNEVENPGCI